MHKTNILWKNRNAWNAVLRSSDDRIKNSVPISAGTLINNRKKQDSNNFVRNVNGILRKNRRILEELNPTGKAKVNFQKLKDKGFNFDYYTNTYKTKAGKVYYYCYEFGYLPIEEDFYFLVMKQDYVDS